MSECVHKWIGVGVGTVSGETAYPPMTAIIACEKCGEFKLKQIWSR